MNKETFKKWCKDHEVEIVLGTTLGTIVAAGIVIALKDRRIPVDTVIEKLDDGSELITKNLPEFYDTHKFVDQDIFTSVAPKLEDFVLNEGLDGGIIETIYEVKHPADNAEGFRKVLKHVVVQVTTDKDE